MGRSVTIDKLYFRPLDEVIDEPLPEIDFGKSLRDILRDEAYLKTFWNAFFDNDIKYAAKKLFTVCHLKFFEKQEVPGGVADLEQLERELSDAFEEAMIQIVAQDEPDNDGSVKSGPRSAAQLKKDQETSRFTLFKTFYETIVRFSLFFPQLFCPLM